MDDSKLEELKRIMAEKQQAAREEQMRKATHEAAMNEPGLETPMIDPIDLAVLPISAPGSAMKALSKVAGNEIGSIGRNVLAKEGAEALGSKAATKFPGLFGKAVKEGGEEIAEEGAKKVVKSGPPNWAKYAEDLKNPPTPEIGLAQKIKDAARQSSLSKTEIGSSGMFNKGGTFQQANAKLLKEGSDAAKFARLQELLKGR